MNGYHKIEINDQGDLNVTCPLTPLTSSCKHYQCNTQCAWFSQDIHSLVRHYYCQGNCIGKEDK
jgi:hypothetical protein